MFFSSHCGRSRPPSSHTQQKKKISFQRGETRTESPLSSLQKAKKRKKESKIKGRKPKKKRVTSIFTLFRSLSLSALSLSDALFNKFHARKRHIFVAVVVSKFYSHIARIIKMASSVLSMSAASLASKSKVVSSKVFSAKKSASRKVSITTRATGTMVDDKTGIKKMRDGIKEAADENLLTPRFYTTGTFHLLSFHRRGWFPIYILRPRRLPVFHFFSSRSYPPAVAFLLGKRDIFFREKILGG